MQDRIEAARQRRDFANATAESAARSGVGSVQDTQDWFSRLNVDADPEDTAQHNPSVMPSTELRRNVTRRRSQERARDSVGSTSVPVERLISRKSKERPKDVAYSSETKVPVKRESGTTQAVSVWSPDVTRRLIPGADEDPYRHKVLKEMWVRKKALEEDIDEALNKQSQNDFHHLMQQHKQINQDMHDVLVGSPLESATPARPFNLDEESFVLWFKYDGDEISVVAWLRCLLKL
jgi:hypothetical protein